MGGTSSKPEPIGTPLPNFAPDAANAKYEASYVNEITRKATEYATDLQNKLTAATTPTTSNWFANFKLYGIIFGVIVLLVGVTVAIIAVVDYFRCRLSYPPVLFPCALVGAPDHTGAPLLSPGPPPGTTGTTGATGTTCSTGPAMVSSSPQPMLWNWIYGSYSGNLISHMFDSTSGASVPSAIVPVSAEGQGAYGIQWWMFVKDWNYGYGKEKTVLSRSDATNSAISNPRVTLAPTENNLRVSVSIFPNEEGGGSKTEPAPANNPGSSDDVFVCEVPNIPLQSWISVSVTVFDRNLDVYINGNLVKSCFLPGVPKPAAGNIDISKDGGFSGYMCDLNHYPKALVPSDAQAFYSAGTSCSSQGGSPSQSYSMKFGVYDVKGKEVKEYTF